MAVLNIRIRFKNTYLGILWAAVEPLLYFLVLLTVFTGLREDTENFAIYLLSGILVYHIFSRGTSGGLGSLTANGSIIKSLNINHEIFPVVSTVAIGLLSFVDVAVFLILMPFFQFIPTWTIILMPIPIILLLFLILGVSYLLSIITVYVKDIQHLWVILVHALLFISPIFWYLEKVGGVLLEIHKINPLGRLIEISHQLIVEGNIPPLSEWLYTSFLVFVIFTIGYIVFQKFNVKAVEEL